MSQSYGRLARTGAVVAAVVVSPLVASPAFADVRRTTFRHTSTRVSVGSKYVDLQAVGRRFEIVLETRDENGKRTIAMLRTSRRDRQGQAWLMTGQAAKLRT